MLFRGKDQFLTIIIWTLGGPKRNTFGLSRKNASKAKKSSAGRQNFPDGRKKLFASSIWKIFDSLLPTILAHIKQI